MHDKIILVDNKPALIGGRNIDDRFYLNDVYGDPFVKDREVLIYQEKVNTETDNFPSVIDEIENYYDSLWEHKYTKPKHRNMSKRKIKKGHVSLEELRLQCKDFKVKYLGTYFKDVHTIDWGEVTLPANGIRLVANPIDSGKINLLTNSKAATPNVLAFSAFESQKKAMIDEGVGIYE